MITPDELRKIMPESRKRADVFAPYINDAMRIWGIDTPNREAMFLAQIAHESGELRWTHEIWGPTESQKKYELRLDLGNTQPGDGYKYRGRGLIQVTGRFNYQNCGDALKLNLLLNPELLETPEYASQSAAWFWNVHGCNELADRMAFAQITRKINGGMNGWTSRLKYLANAKGVISA